MFKMLAAKVLATCYSGVKLSFNITRYFRRNCFSIILIVHWDMGDKFGNFSWNRQKLTFIWKMVSLCISDKWTIFLILLCTVIEIQTKIALTLITHCQANGQSVNKAMIINKSVKKTRRWFLPIFYINRSMSSKLLRT